MSALPWPFNDEARTYRAEVAADKPGARWNCPFVYTCERGSYYSAAELDEHLAAIHGDEIAAMKEDDADESARPELLRLREQRAAVLAIHRRDVESWSGKPAAWCAACSSDDHPEADYLWPCPTARALGVTE